MANTTPKDELTDMDIRLTKTELQVAEMQKDVDFLNKVIVKGNGNPSLMADVRTLVTFMTEQKDNYKYWSRWIIAGILANIIGYTFAAVLWFIKIAPLLEQIVQRKP